MRKLQVGQTPQRISSELSGRYGATIHVKYENMNGYSGTFKDRRCAALLETSAEKEKVVFVHVTSGNSGCSMGRMAKEEEEVTGKKRTVVNLVDSKTPSLITDELKKCSVVHRMKGLRKGVIGEAELIVIAKKAAGFDYQDSDVVLVESYKLVNGYSSIIKEIAETGIVPKYIVCPVGGGELAVELVGAAKAIWPKNTPVIIGATIKENVICEKGDFFRRIGKSIADKLVTPYSKFKALVLGMVERGEIGLVRVSEREIATEYHYLNNIVGIPVEPSAAAAFAGAKKYGFNPEEVVVIINTGRGIFDQKAVERVLWKRITKTIKYAAAALFGATIALLAAGGWWNAKQEYHEKLTAQAEYYAQRQWKGDLLENSTQVCRLVHKLRQKKSLAEAVMKRRCTLISLSNLTNGQLEFFNGYMNLGGPEVYSSGIDGIMQKDLVANYQNGEFDETLKGKMKWLRRKWREGTLGSEIYWRMVGVYNSIRYGNDIGNVDSEK